MTAFLWTPCARVLAVSTCLSQNYCSQNSFPYMVLFWIDQKEECGQDLENRSELTYYFLKILIITHSGAQTHRHGQVLACPCSLCLALLPSHWPCRALACQTHILSLTEDLQMTATRRLSTALLDATLAARGARLPRFITSSDPVDPFARAWWGQVSDFSLILWSCLQDFTFPVSTTILIFLCQ